jgi:hypothetical protein
MPDETVFENISSTKTIEITLGQTEGESIAIPDGKTIIKPLQKMHISKSFDCGCAKLFVWEAKDLLWQGVVPLCGASPIKINPDTKKVSVLDGDIPCLGNISNFGDTLKENLKENFENESSKSDFNWFWILLILLVILYFLFKRYFTKK